MSNLNLLLPLVMSLQALVKSLYLSYKPSLDIERLQYTMCLEINVQIGTPQLSMIRQPALKQQIYFKFM